MPPDRTFPSGLRLRLTTLLLPPVGLVLLWRQPWKIGRKLLGTVGILIYSLLYSALVVWLLIRFTGLEVEWRGGYMPRFTYHKTRPDYDALEKSRLKQAAIGGNTNATPALSFNKRQLTGSTKAPWPGFRGPHRDGIYDQPILTNWPAAGLRALWRQPIGG